MKSYSFRFIDTISNEKDELTMSMSPPSSCFIIKDELKFYVFVKRHPNSPNRRIDVKRNQ